MQEVVGSTPILSTALKAAFGWLFCLSMFYIYILYSSETDRYYVGSCANINIRFEQHNTGRNKSTKGGIPWIMKYTETFSTLGAARKREQEIKKAPSSKYKAASFQCFLVMPVNGLFLKSGLSNAKTVLPFTCVV
jgi:putative endonuclease